MSIEPMSLCGFWLHKICEKSSKIRVSRNDFLCIPGLCVNEIISVVHPGQNKILARNKVMPSFFTTKNVVGRFLLFLQLRWQRDKAAERILLPPQKGRNTSLLPHTCTGNQQQNPSSNVDILISILFWLYTSFCPSRLRGYRGEIPLCAEAPTWIPWLRRI